MILQLNPPLPVITPKGKALAHFMIDEGIEHDLKWVCFQDSTGECWTFCNPDVRAQKNITQGRDYISPFYDPQDVAFPKDHFVAPASGIYKFEGSLTNNEFLSGQKIKEPETDLEKQIKEARRMSETMPNFEDLVKDSGSIVDERISKISSELRGNEMKIVDDFCKAYYASLMHMTGKEFMQIVDEISLNIQQFFKDGQVATRYWFSPKEEDED